MSRNVAKAMQCFTCFQKLRIKIFYAAIQVWYTAFQHQCAAICFAVVYFIWQGLQGRMVCADKPGRRQQFFIAAQVAAYKNRLAVADVKFSVRPSASQYSMSSILMK